MRDFHNIYLQNSEVTFFQSADLMELNQSESWKTKPFFVYNKKK